VVFPAALEAFGALLKRTGKNLAALGGGAEAWHAAVWAAIRAGWREGYSLGADIALEPGPGSMESARQAIGRAAACSRFVAAAGAMIESPAAHLSASAEPGWIRQEFVRRFDLGDASYELSAEESVRLAARFGPALAAAEAAHECIRQTRSALKAGRSFDFELSLEGAGPPTSATDLLFCLHWLKARGHGAQLAAPHPGSAETVASLLAELAPVARHYGCTLSLAWRAEHSAAILSAIGRATAGRISYRFPAAGTEVAASLKDLASHLFV